MRANRMSPLHDHRSAAVSMAMAALARDSGDLKLAADRLAICRNRCVATAGNGTFSGTGYCKLIICQTCQQVRYHEEHADLKCRVLDAMEEWKCGRIVALTISSPLATIPGAADLVDRMLGGWSRFSDRKAFQSVAYGFARSVRLDVDAQANAVSCNTSILLLTERTHAFQTAAEWQTAWHRMPYCDMDRIRSFQRFDMCEPRSWDSVDLEIQKMTRIGLDPLELCEFTETHPACDPQKLGHVLQALRGRKLIRTGRKLMRSAA